MKRSQNVTQVISLAEESGWRALHDSRSTEALSFIRNEAMITIIPRNGKISSAEMSQWDAVHLGRESVIVGPSHAGKAEIVAKFLRTAGRLATGSTLWTLVAKRTGQRFFRPIAGAPVGTWQEVYEASSAVPFSDDVEVHQIPAEGEATSPEDRDNILTGDGKRVPIKWAAEPFMHMSYGPAPFRESWEPTAIADLGTHVTVDVSSSYGGDPLKSALDALSAASLARSGDRPLLLHVERIGTQHFRYTFDSGRVSSVAPHTDPGSFAVSVHTPSADAAVRALRERLSGPMADVTYSVVPDGAYGGLYRFLVAPAPVPPPSGTLSHRISPDDLRSDPYALDRRMEIDAVVRVSPDGDVRRASGVYAPEVVGENGEISTRSDQPWRVITMGYTGQYGYSGPVMHTSEFVGGRLARDILERPGLYVALAVENLDDGDAIGWVVAHLPECWHVGSNDPGYLPSSEPACCTSYTDAVSALSDALREWGDTDDMMAADLIAATVPESEQEAALEEVSSAALAGSILADDPPAADEPSAWSTTVRGNDDRDIVWWLQPVYSGCDHIGCDHDDEIPSW